MQEIQQFTGILCWNISKFVADAQGRENDVKDGGVWTHFRPFLISVMKNT